MWGQAFQPVLTGQITPSDIASTKTTIHALISAAAPPETR
jgi:hypothetical protein